MDTRQALKIAIDSADMLSRSYLEGLSDKDLLVRPVPGANHIAWQLGHLIKSEHGMMSALDPQGMPPLPDGFGAKYESDKSSSDDPAQFDTKETFLKLYTEQRAGTLKALSKQADGDFDKPAPEQLQSFCKSVAEVYAMQGTHWLMHIGQWAIVRRKLGFKPIM